MLDHGSNSGKRFSKWPPEAILKNLYVNMFCSCWPILMIKMSSRGVCKVPNWLERVLIWPEVTIMRNSKWPPFLLQEIIFLFMLIYNIIDTGSPWARIGHHAPLTISILMRSFLGMLIAMLREITGFRPFFLNNRHENISTYRWHRISILVSTPMLSGSKNRLKPLRKILGHSIYGEFGKIQDGNWWKSFYDKIRMFILKTKLFDMLKCYIEEARYGYNGHLPPQPTLLPTSQTEY